MLRLLKSRPGVLCDRVSRRELLEIGGASLLGLTLADLLHAEGAAASRSAEEQPAPEGNRRATPLQGVPPAAAGPGRLPPRARSCIILFLAGGPSHLDMWDMKPEAPAEIRGEFKPISTTVPGVQFSEHLPRLAQLAHRVALVRSMQHRVAVAHWAATYFALTGHDRGDSPTAGAPGPNDHPAIGSVLSALRPPERPIVPYVSLPYITVDVPGSPPQPGVYGGWLGSARDPLFVLRDPNAPDFSVPELAIDRVDEERLNSRRRLLEQVNRGMAALDAHLSVRNLDGYYGRAFSILSSPDTRRAFDLGQEPDSVRESYGRNIYGQSLLLSRRLIEAGTRVVTLKWGPDVLQTWDTHKNNFGKLRGELLPQLDAALPSLLKDLEERGLLGETLVAVMGEFGRTPRIGTVNANALTDSSGRDHWPYCYSLLLAGGGIAPGRVIGRSDKIGAYPAENPITPQDIAATVYTLLGVDPNAEFIDRFGQPVRLVREGRVVAELLA